MSTASTSPSSGGGSGTELHLTCFHGVFAPNASLRAEVMVSPRPPPGPAPGATPARKPKRVRLDWATAMRRTFGIDVWICHCGGRRSVRAIVTHRATAQAMLRNLGLAGAPTPQPASHSPPQRSFSL